MTVWNFIITNLKNKTRVVLLYVLESEGSSPGRKGFKMAVNEGGVFEGTIGGGIMEVKLIELAKSLLKKGNLLPIVKEQHHNKSVGKNQSGLICSGTQTVAIIPLEEKDSPIFSKIINREEEIHLTIDLKNGIRIKSINESKPYSDFKFALIIPRPKTIHIFGAGHVGLALSRQMSILGYRIIQYDDRPDLHTLQKNKYANEVKIVEYQSLDKMIKTNPTDAVVIVSFSYRSDKIILQKLYNKPFAYIGMMGSDSKIAMLKKELAEEGILEEAISHVFTPIGINMYSKTAEEIALSIAGQIVLETNKKMPTGRNYKL